MEAATGEAELRTRRRLRAPNRRRRFAEVPRFRVPREAPVRLHEHKTFSCGIKRCCDAASYSPAMPHHCEAPPFAPASCLHPSCMTPAAAAPPRSADAAHLCHPNPSSCATRRAPECFFVSAAERSAAAGILQEMKRQETGGDPKKLRPRRRRHLTRE